MSLDFNELLASSRKTQTNGIYGEGTPCLFIGDRGISKTAQVRGFCEPINNLLITIILVRTPSIDVGGINVPDFEKGELVTMIKRTLLGDVPGAENYDGGCVFFDEIGNSLDDQQTAIQSLIQDRELEGHKIPDHVWFVAATNPPEANCGSNPITSSLLDRFSIIEITHEDIITEIFPRWLEWADGKIHPLITGFLRWVKSEPEGQRNFIHCSDYNSKELARPSLRSWHKLSGLLWQGLSDGTMRRHGEGLVGRAAYIEFSGYVRLGGELASVEDIYESPNTAHIPSGDGALSANYAVISNICADLQARKGETLTTQRVDAVITYLRRLDGAFAVFGFKQAANSHKDFANASAEYAQFLKDNEDLVIG